MSFIKAKNLSKSYGEHVVLEKLNIQVTAGEFITLVGASGCGKSTFLKMLIGTEQPTTGQLLLKNEPLIAEPDPQRGIVFQQYSVFPHLTVEQNVLLGKEMEAGHFLGRMFGQQRKAAMDEVHEWLNAVGLYSAKNKYISELSGGMKQRLAIAQALIKRPAILLLDEPFGALDPGIRKDMHQLVLDLWQQHKLTVFMVTHDLSEGFYLGTRLWVFDKIRKDPHAPERFGSTITFDLPVGDTRNSQLRAINESLVETSLV
jgi:NitT/TauT family transport system ATP-binding protein